MISSVVTPVRAVLAGVAVLVIAYLVWRHAQLDPQTQATATFSRIQNEIQTNDASGLVAELHPRYEFTAMWPGTFEAAEADGLSSSSAESPRALARRGIAFLFLQNQAGLRLSYELAAVTAQPDGTVACDVSLEVRTGDGGPILVSGRPSHHFVLAWSGWFLPKLLIVSHDHIDVAR